MMRRFFRGEVPAVCFEPDGRVTPDAPTTALILPGSFNPLHVGHLRIAATAVNLLNKPVAFEISTYNFDKGEISPDEVRRRLKQFAWLHPVWLTKEPTFLGKARLFPRATFVIGVDTAYRLVSPKYYGENVGRMMKMFEEVRVLGCNFLVAGRLDEEGEFMTLVDVKVPDRFEDLFEAIPEVLCRYDISSTQLRGQCG